VHDFEPKGYALAISLGDVRFDGKVTIDGDVTRQANVIWLHSAGLEIGSARAIQGGTVVALAAAPAPLRDLVALLPPTPLAPGRWSIEVVYRGLIATSRELMSNGYQTTKRAYGLFQQYLGGDRYVFTQFEPRFARTAIPCIDEPDRKVPWQLTLEVPRTDLALSNTPAVRETLVGTDRKRVEFAPTLPLPSYLVAFAVGPFELVDAGRTKRGVPIRIATQRGRTADANHAVQWTTRLFDLVEELVGVPYPYGKLDFVAVPSTGIGWGAMENPGLITFNHTLMKSGWIDIALHEIAHQWFGNLVTLRDWNDIWLNEGWATWVAHEIAARLDVDAAEPDLPTGTPAFAVEWKMPKAARVPASDVRVDETLLPYFSGFNSERIIDRLERYLGKAKLLDVLRAYLRAHAHGVVATADLIAVLDEPALGIALEASLDAPLSVTPAVVAELRCRGTPELVLSLRHPSLWHSAPACIVYEQRGARVESCVHVTSTTTIPLQACPAWAIPSERTPYVTSITPPAKLLDLGWPLTPAESERVLADANRDVPLALRIAVRLLDVEATQAAAATFLLTLERQVPDRLRPQFDAAVRAALGARARDALNRPGIVIRNGPIIELVAAAGDVEVQRAASRLVGDPSEVSEKLQFLLRIKARFDDATVRRLVELLATTDWRPQYRYAQMLRESDRVVEILEANPMPHLDPQMRTHLLSGGCSQARVDQLTRSSLRDAALAAGQVKACVRHAAALEPAFKAWLVPTRVRSTR